MLTNRKGFSLIQLLIGLCIASVLAKTSMDLFKIQIDSSTKVRQLASWQDMKADIRSLLRHPTACQLSLVGLPLDGEEHPLVIRDSSNNAIFQDGQELDGGYTLTVRAQADTSNQPRRLVTLLVRGTRQNPERSTSWTSRHLVTVSGTAIDSCVDNSDIGGASALGSVFLYPDCANVNVYGNPTGTQSQAINCGVATYTPTSSSLMISIQARMTISGSDQYGEVQLAVQDVASEQFVNEEGSPIPDANRWDHIFNQFAGIVNNQRLDITTTTQKQFRLTPGRAYKFYVRHRAHDCSSAAIAGRTCGDTKIHGNVQVAIMEFQPAGM